MKRGKPTFDLLSEAWIPVLMVNGENRIIGIHEILRDAHLILEITGESPPVTLSIHRLLLAILYRVYDGKRRLKEHLLQQGKVSRDALGRYFLRHKNSFDIIHPERPFYQTPRLETFKGKGYDASKGPNSLIYYRASGNNVTLFDHTFDTEATSSLSEMARWLVATQNTTVLTGQHPATSPNGKTSYPGKAWLSNGAAFMVTGYNLLETLALNLIGYEDATDACRTEQGDDLPPWEQVETVSPRRGCHGVIDLLTRQSRSIRIVPPGGDGLVRKVHIANGAESDRNAIPKDPMWVCDDDGVPLRISKIYANKSIFCYLPEILEKLTVLLGGSQAKECWSLGIVTDNAAIIKYYHERIPLGSDLSKQAAAFRLAQSIGDVARKKTYGKDADASRQVDEAYWRLVIQHATICGWEDPTAWTSALRDAAKKATFASLGQHLYHLEEAIDEVILSTDQTRKVSPLEEKDNKTVCQLGKTTNKKYLRALPKKWVLERDLHKKCKGLTRVALEALVLRGDVQYRISGKKKYYDADSFHVKTSRIKGMSHRVRPSKKQEDFIKWLSATDRTEEDLVSYLGGKPDIAHTIVAKVFYKKTPKNKHFNLVKILAAMPGKGAFKSFDSLLGARNARELEVAVKDSVKEVKKSGQPIFWDYLLSDLVAWEKDPETVKDRWAAEYASVGRASRQS